MDKYCIAPQTIGARITRARKDIDMTRAELARRLHTSPQRLEAWEKDKTAPTRTILPALCEVLRVSPEWIMHGTQMMSAEQREILALWDLLTPEQRAAIRALAPRSQPSAANDPISLFAERRRQNK